MYKIFIYIFLFTVISVKSFADQSDKRLNYLFNKLIITENQQEIIKVTNQIWNIWHEIDDPKITRDFETGVQMMNLGYLPRAIDYFNKVIFPERMTKSPF